MKRISKGWRRGSSSQGTASTVTSSGADSRGSARSGGMASIAFTGSSGGRSRHHNLLMETNMAFENGSDGGRTKRSHGTGFFAFSQVGGGSMGSLIFSCCKCRSFAPGGDNRPQHPSDVLLRLWYLPAAVGVCA